MRVELDISQSLLPQFRLGLSVSSPTRPDCLVMREEFGTGDMELVALPDGIEFYHYTSIMKEPLQIASTNPEGSPWVGLNINLAETDLRRMVGNDELVIHRSRPSGILVHTPGSQIEGTNDVNLRFESVFIRLHRDFFKAYSAGGFAALYSEHGVILFEDLDYQSETLLREIIRSKTDRLYVHAKLLEFIRLFLGKIEAREQGSVDVRLHSDEIQALFRAAAALRNSIASKPPSISELAKLTHMGTTKFKSSFRAVFGVAPIQYHHKIKMEYAKNQLLLGDKSPSDLSYELGYSHPSKFSAAFKNHFDILPSRVQGAQPRL